jgi:hypothetical protein
MYHHCRDAERREREEDGRLQEEEEMRVAYKQVSLAPHAYIFVFRIICSQNSYYTIKRNT